MHGTTHWCSRATFSCGLSQVGRTWRESLCPFCCELPGSTVAVESDLAPRPRLWNRSPRNSIAYLVPKTESTTPSRSAAEAFEDFLDITSVNLRCRGLRRSSVCNGWALACRWPEDGQWRVFKGIMLSEACQCASSSICCPLVKCVWRKVPVDFEIFTHYAGSRPQLSQLQIFFAGCGPRWRMGLRPCFFHERFSARWYLVVGWPATCQTNWN